MRLLRPIALVLLLPVALVLGVGLGVRIEDQRLAEERAQLESLFMVATGSGQVLQGDPEEVVDLSILWSTWRLLQQTYVSPSALQTGPMVFGAVRGLVDAVGDPYTLFMDPEETQAFTESLAGTLEGIGAQLDMQDGVVVVVAPLRGSPAERAGLLPRDLITAVDGAPLIGLRLEEVVTRIRGLRGTSVTLTVEREGERAPLTITIVREELHIPSVESRTLSTPEGPVFLLTLNQFGDDTIPAAAAALGAIPRNVRGIVLDLRSNGGGYLEGAVDLVSMFAESGTVVTVHRRDVPPEAQAVSGNVVQPTLPLVVLVNGGSASASEIAAGALRDLGRATLIGTQTFGKGTVQELVALPGGSSLRVTVAKWLTPSGHDLGSVGLEPDIVVDRTVDDYRNDRDPQLDRAVEWLQKGGTQ